MAIAQVVITAVLEHTCSALLAVTYKSE